MAVARPQDAEEIRLGNFLADFSIKVIQACIGAKIPVCLENPSASRLWHLPALVKFASRKESLKRRVDMCQHGSSHKKSTRVQSWFCHGGQELQQRCQGARGLCSATGLPHVILEGRDKVTKATLTSQVSAYPASFAADAGDLLYDSQQELELSLLGCV